MRHDLIINGIDYNLELDKVSEMIHARVEVLWIMWIYKQKGVLFYNAEKPVIDQDAKRREYEESCRGQEGSPKKADYQEKGCSKKGLV